MNIFGILEEEEEEKEDNLHWLMRFQVGLMTDLSFQSEEILNHPILVIVHLNASVIEWMVHQNASLIENRNVPVIEEMAFVVEELMNQNADLSEHVNVLGMLEEDEVHFWWFLDL